MKILIISYYAFPLNAVSSYRIESFCDGFTKEGADVSLLTRHWGESFNSWDDVLTSNLKEVEIKKTKNYREIFLPFSARSKESKGLVEFYFRLPDSFKLNLGWTKYVMRLAFEGNIPPAITWRKEKVGFKPPFNEWMKSFHTVD